MYRDPSEFRERFKAYKDGKSVREIYGLPGYSGGKKSAEFDDYTKKRIDYYYNILRNKGFDPISASGIIGNAIQESSLNPNAVNDFGYSGLFQNSQGIRKAIEAQYGNHSEESLLRYLDDWVSGNRWIRKGKYANYTALGSGAYKRKGYTTAEQAADAFLKLYERAVVVKDSNIVRDQYGNPVYQDRGKRLNYANRVYNYLSNLQQQIENTGKELSTPITLPSDATRVVTTIPQEKAIDYTDKRNTVGAEIDRIIWANNVMNNIKGMAYNVPIWESKTLPALEPFEYDTATFKTYEDGKIEQGHKLIPIDKARAWARHHDADEPWYIRYSKNVTDGILNTVESFTEPYRNTINGRMGVDDAISIGLDVGAGIGAKAIRRAAKSIKPTKTSISLKGKTPRELAEYFELNPDLITDADPIKVAEAVDFIEQDALPRVQRAANKRGRNVTFNPKSITFKLADFRDSKLGGVSTPNKTVYMRDNASTDHYVHEMSHEMRRATGETPEEASRLFSTYKNSDAFLKAHPEFAQLLEDEAVNTQLRYLISHANGGVKGKELDSIIDNMPYDKFEVYAILANAYTNDMARTGGLNRNTYKNTLKYVGATYPMLYAASLLRNKYKNGKIPGYKNGKDDEFESELDWSPESWFSKRVPKPDGTLYTEDEANRLRSHLNEYLNIEKTSKNNGTWLSMPDGKKWEGDPRSWVMMQSSAYKKNYQPQPWYTGLAEWVTTFDYGNGTINTNKLTRAPYYNGQMWFSNNKNYGETFANYIDSKGENLRDYIESEKNIKGYNFLSAIPIDGNYRKLLPPKNGTFDYWQNMPYEKTDTSIRRLDDSQILQSLRHEVSDPTMMENLRKDRKKVLTDDVVNWSQQLGDQGIYLYNVNDGPIGEKDDNGNKILFSSPVINEFISQPGFTNKVKFIEGNTGDFDITNPYKYAYVPTEKLDELLRAADGKLPYYKDGKIHIKPANRGKFNATKKRTGKTTEELTHSKNPITRKRAIFALNAKKWKH